MTPDILGLRGLSPAFHRLLSASIASNLADGIIVVTFSLAAAALTKEPAQVAGVAVAGTLPQVLGALHAGAIADRMDRRRLLVGVQVLRLGVLALLTLATVVGALGIPLLAAGAFALAIGQTFYDTTSQAILPMVASPEQLTRANSRLGAAETLADQFLGPPLGGVLVSLGAALAWGGGMLGYVLALAGLLLLRGDFRVRRTGPERSLTGDIVDGVRWLATHPLQRTISLMVAVGAFAASAVFAVFVLYAVAPGPVGLSEVGYGLLLTAMGVGSLIGAAIVERIERRLGTARTLIASHVAFGLLFVIPAVTAAVVPVALAFGLFGLTTMVWNVTNVSLRQRFIPHALYGRVHAGHRLVTRGGALLGGITGGVVGSVAGLTTVFWLAAVVVLLSAAGALVVNDRNVSAALAASAEGSSGSAARLG